MHPDQILRGVSRSFFLSLRVLPAPVRPQISLAYLLARASDTVADTKAVPRERRLELLRSMKAGDLRGVCRLASGQALPAERLLLENLHECGAALAGLETGDQALIRSLLDTIISGQMWDLETFPGENAAEASALKDEPELDRYAYMVAGCVGEFWTKICAAHCPAFGALDQGEMVSLGVRFGKGLQLVNILRDMASDLRIVTHLPVAEPRALLDPARRPEIQAMYLRRLDAALEHLDAGWRYTLKIPPSLWRLRLACIWPIWIGLGTIELLRRSNPLDPAQRVMVSQGRVNGFLAKSVLFARSDRLLQRTYRNLRAAAA